jgi:hypothetical protein
MASAAAPQASFSVNAAARAHRAAYLLLQDARRDARRTPERKDDSLLLLIDLGADSLPLLLPAAVVPAVASLSAFARLVSMRKRIY